MSPRRRLLTCLALLALPLVFACGSDEERLAAHVERGAEYAEAGELAEALLEYRSALQLQPEDAELNFQIGQLLEGLGRPDQAVFFYSEAARLDPRRLDAPLYEARLLMFDDPARVEDLVERVVERDPANVRARVLMSEFALARGDVDEALEAAFQAVALDPKFAAAHDQLGVVYSARVRMQHEGLRPPDESEYRKAIAAFDQALAHTAPEKRWRTLVKKAMVYASWDGQRDVAIEAFREALEAALEADGDAVVSASRGAIFYARAVSDPLLEREALRALVDSGKATLPDWRTLARREVATGGSSEAIYQRLLAERPDEIEAHIAYAFFLANQGRGREAIAHLEALRGEGGFEEPRVLRAIANVAHAAGEPTRGREAVDALLGQYPNHPEARLARAQRLLSRGRREAGAEILRQLSGGPLVREDVFYLLARVELRLGNLAAARDAVEQAIELDPGFSIQRHELRARIQRAQGDWGGVNETLGEIARNIGTLTPQQRLLNIQAYYAGGRSDLARRRLELLLRAETRPKEAVLEFQRREGARQPERARALLEAELKRAPRDPELIAALVRLDTREGLLEQARERIETAIQQNPLSVPATLFLTRARVRRAQGDLAGAEEDVRLVVGGARDPRPIILLTELLTEQGKLDEAVEQIEALPTGERSDLLLGHLYVALGREDEAIARFEGAIENGTATEATRNDLAYLMAKRGQDLDRALTLAREAKSALPDSPETAHTLGFVLLGKGLPDAALEHFRQAVALAEGSNVPRGVYWYHLGLALRDLGRRDDAAEALARSLEVEGDAFAERADARAALEELRAES